MLKLLTLIVLSLTITSAFVCNPGCQNNGLCYNVTTTQNTCNCDATNFTGFDCSLTKYNQYYNAYYQEFNGAQSATFVSQGLTVEVSAGTVTGVYNLYSMIVSLLNTGMGSPSNTHPTYVWYKLLMYNYNSYIQTVDTPVTVIVDTTGHTGARLYVYVSNSWVAFETTCSTVQSVNVNGNLLTVSGCNFGSGMFGLFVPDSPSLPSELVPQHQQPPTPVQPPVNPPVDQPDPPMAAPPVYVPNCSNNKSGDIIFLMTLIGLILVFTF